MGKWTGLSPGTLKSMIRTIDNKIAYRTKQNEANKKLIADWEKQREELAEALAENEGAE